jgi:hypothetical protein
VEDLERLHDQLGIIKPKVIKVLYLRHKKETEVQFRRRVECQ